MLGPFSLSLRHAVEAGAIDLSTLQCLSVLNAEVNRQAATLGCLQDLWRIGWVPLAAMALLLLLK